MKAFFQRANHNKTSDPKAHTMPALPDSHKEKEKKKDKEKKKSEKPIQAEETPPGTYDLLRDKILWIERLIDCPVSFPTWNSNAEVAPSRSPLCTCWTYKDAAISM